MSNRSLSPSNRSLGDVKGQYREAVNELEDNEDGNTLLSDSNDYLDEERESSDEMSAESKSRQQSPEKSSPMKQTAYDTTTITGRQPIHGDKGRKSRRDDTKTSPKGSPEVMLYDKSFFESDPKSTTVAHHVEPASFNEKPVRFSPQRSAYPREIPESKKEPWAGDNTSIHGSKYLILTIIGICIAVLAIVTRGLFASGKTDETQPTKNVFGANWSILKRNFSDQGESFWIVTASATSSVFRKEQPDDPAVILLIIPKSVDLSTSECFLRKYASTVAGSFGEREPDIISFKIQFYTDTEPHQLKLKIDRDLEDGFNSGRNIAIIEHLELLPAEVAMIFYKYCDNNNAPFKRVVILMTLHLETEEEEQAEKRNESFVEEKLAGLWEHIIGEDKFRPLMPRIANSIAFLRPEKKETLSNIGC